MLSADLREYYGPSRHVCDQDGVTLRVGMAVDGRSRAHFTSFRDRRNSRATSCGERLC